MRARGAVRPANYWNMLRRVTAGVRSTRRARAGTAVTREFDRLGRWLGRRQFMRRHFAAGLQQWLNPISVVRYFEFDFCARQMPPAPQRVLDVSSPRLFALGLARALPDTQFVLANPDSTDLDGTREMVKALRLTNVELQNATVDKLVASHRRAFDFVTCISVIEHIAGAYDDREAMEMLVDLPAPGGTLALTLPLSKSKVHEEEYYPAGVNPYPGTHQVANADGRYFFQRLYSQESIETRLLGRIHAGDVALEWWGERELDAYERYRRGRLYGWGADALFFHEQCRRFDDYVALPGMGVCGIVVRLPAGSAAPGPASMPGHPHRT